MFYNGQCSRHGKVLFLLGFCTKCIPTETQLEVIAYVQMEEIRASAPEVSHDEEEEEVIPSPSQSRLAS